MRWQLPLALLAAVLLSACASTLNVLDDVNEGLTELEAMDSVRGTPTRVLEGGDTKYLVYGFSATFLDMDDDAITDDFVNIQDGRVGDEGMVGMKEGSEIHRIGPEFDTDRLLMRSGNAASTGADSHAPIGRRRGRPCVISDPRETPCSACTTSSSSSTS